VIRDLSRLAARDFDLLVVGGGVYGLATAYDAAQRGLSVALVERADFGGATSFNHLKTIHGGLRYLQSADLGRMRESIRERRAFARIAPRFVAPLPFVMPTSASLTRNSWAMRVAFALDALVGSDRNEGLGPAHHLPAGRVISGAEALELLNWAVGGAPIRSAALWYDYESVRGDQLTLSFALAAVNHGAVLANYTEALEPERDTSNRVVGAGARDVLTGDRFRISARLVVNAAGPWGAVVLSRAGVPGRWPLLKAMNLVTSRPAPRAAVVSATRLGRALVLLPWQGRLVVGTSESPDERMADDQAASRAEMVAFIAEINETFPALELGPGEVTLVHRGVVPAIHAGGRLSLLGHSRIIDHAADGTRGLISLVGVKYTTARVVAERAVDLVLRKLGKPPVPSRTSTATLPGAALTDTDPLDPVAHAIREEMAQTLADVVIRRTGVGASGHPGDEVANQYASAMQSALSWSEERKKSELEALARFYWIED
jgi:glycerol-3-phosphate dehydrogenase